MKAQAIHDEPATLWADRRTHTGHETAEELAGKLNESNWREHPDEQAGAVDESLDALGWVGSVKINERSGRLIDGHLRVKRALLKDPDGTIPVDYYDLSPEEEDLALQVLDASTEMATPNAERLAALMERTRAMVADRPALRGMLEALKVRAGVNGGEPVEDVPSQIDKAQELQEKWQCEVGQLWAMGEHRLLIGDCRNADDIARVCEGRKVNGVFTSPPYAMQRAKQYGGVPTAEYVDWWEAVQANVKGVLAEDGSFFVNIKEHCEDGQRVLYCKKLLIAMVERWGWRWVDELCWVKQGVPGKWAERFKNGYEPIYQFSKKKTKFNQNNVMHLSDYSFSYTGNESDAVTGSGFFQGHTVNARAGAAYPSNVIKVPVGNMAGDTKEHPGSYPINLPTFFIRAYSDPGDLWLDPFAGSGTVIIAAHNEDRIGLGIEILPKYGAVILERYQSHTNDEPVLVGG